MDKNHDKGVENSNEIKDQVEDNNVVVEKVKTTEANEELLDKLEEELDTLLEEKEAAVKAKEQAEKDKKDLQDKYLRLHAEFDNFRKRKNKEHLDLLSTAASKTIKAILPVVDDFDRAKKVIDEQETTEPYMEGVILVYNKLKSILVKQGLTVMETDGQEFNADLHEAIAEVPVPNMKGKIIDTVELGYKLNDKIIRFPRVVVGK